MAVMIIDDGPMDALQRPAAITRWAVFDLEYKGPPRFEVFDYNRYLIIICGQSVFGVWREGGLQQ